MRQQSSAEIAIEFLNMVASTAYDRKEPAVLELKGARADYRLIGGDSYRVESYGTFSNRGHFMQGVYPVRGVAIQAEGPNRFSVGLLEDLPDFYGILITRRQVESIAGQLGVAHAVEFL